MALHFCGFMHLYKEKRTCWYKSTHCVLLLKNSLSTGTVNVNKMMMDCCFNFATAIIVVYLNRIGYAFIKR